MLRRVTRIEVFLALSLIFFLGMLTIAIGASNVIYSETDTTEIVATVQGVEIAGEGIDQYCIIFSEEFGDRLDTNFLSAISDTNDFMDLQPGELVFFRVPNIWLDHLDEMAFMPMVSIRTEEMEIVSLQSYNKYFSRLFLGVRIGSIGLTLFFLLLSIYCVLRLKGIEVLRRKIEPSM